LYYVIENEGTGKRPTGTSTVNVTCKGYFLDGSVFEQNFNRFTIGLNQVIRGWREGVQLFGRWKRNFISPFKSWLWK